MIKILRTPIFILTTILLAFSIEASENRSFFSSKKTETQKILEKSDRHTGIVALSSIALYSGMHHLPKPGLFRKFFALTLIGTGLGTLYKTEQATNKSTIQIITQPLYDKVVGNATKLNDLVDRGYTIGVKHFDKTIDWAKEAAKDYVEKK